MKRSQKPTSLRSAASSRVSSSLRLIVALQVCASLQVSAQRASLVAGVTTRDAGAVRAAAWEAGLQQPVLLVAQAFSLTFNGAKVGALISGIAATPRAHSTEAHVCFTAYVPTTGRMTLIQTVGSGRWEAVNCTGVEAVGVSRSARKGRIVIAFIYAGTSPNSDVKEPVVFDIQNWHFSLDSVATSGASLRGATTVKAAFAASTKRSS